MKYFFIISFLAISFFSCQKKNTNRPQTQDLTGKWGYIGKYVNGILKPDSKNIHYTFTKDSLYTYADNKATPVTGRYRIELGYGANFVTLYRVDNSYEKYGYSLHKDTLLLTTSGSQNITVSAWLLAK